MEIYQAQPDQLDSVYDLTAQVIREVFPYYYPGPVAEFFLNLHSREEILKDIKEGSVYLVKDREEYVGTGTWHRNHLSRIFIRTDCQKKGYGGFLMDYLEEKSSQTGKTVLVESSLPGAGFYEKRGYKTLCHRAAPVGGGYMLVYEIMRKKL
ncbi:MAG TPA: GNAT family N-acetyltransferase [Candidatus Choladousia intestinigallinarum]|nr:GNAT family N-acetyltransferase [Candidatus Choladousia intestinigallinarum]